MNEQVLKMALAQTAELKIFENIPKNLPQAEVSEKFKKRLKKFNKKKNKIGFIAAAIAVVLLACPIIATQFKSPANKTKSVLIENDLVVGIDDISKTTTIKTQETTTYSKEYQDNLMAGSKQLSILKSIEGFDDYYPFYDDKGMLNILYWDEESYEIIKKHLDAKVVIFKKVMFSNEYLLNIKNFLVSRRGSEYSIYMFGSGDSKNSVLIGITDKNKKEDILKLLHENIENFDERAVRFEVIETSIVEE